MDPSVALKSGRPLTPAASTYFPIPIWSTIAISSNHGIGPQNFARYIRQVGRACSVTTLGPNFSICRRASAFVKPWGGAVVASIMMDQALSSRMGSEVISRAQLQTAVVLFLAKIGQSIAGQEERAQAQLQVGHAGVKQLRSNRAAAVVEVGDHGQRRGEIEDVERFLLTHPQVEIAAHRVGSQQGRLRGGAQPLAQRRVAGSAGVGGRLGKRGRLVLAFARRGGGVCVPPGA